MSKVFTVGPIHNEQQETMFNTALSTAVDSMIEIIKLIDRAKNEKEALERALIEEMKKNNVRVLRFECGFIRLDVEEKEKIVVKMNRGVDAEV